MVKTTSNYSVLFSIYFFPFVKKRVNKWVKKHVFPFVIDFVVLCQIVRPQCALIVVDVQNDFISGSLAIDEVSIY